MATPSPLKVLIYGATGAQSGELAPELLRRGHRPFVLTRSAEKAAALERTGAAAVIGDMADRRRLVELSAGVDAVALLIPFAAPSPADALAFGRNAIEAAREAGVRLIVWNSSGAIPAERTGNPGIDLRIDIAEQLRASGVPHITLQPLVYAENLLGAWTAPFVAQEDRVAYPVPPDQRIAWLPAADVAALVAAALERPELAGRAYVVSGAEAPDGPELAGHFSAALGRPIGYHALPPREFGAILDRVFGPGAGDGAAAEYARLWASAERPPLAAEMAPVLADLPVRLRSLRAWVAQHADAFAPPVPAV